jgi:hypothetical protein
LNLIKAKNIAPEKAHEFLTNYLEKNPKNTKALRVLIDLLPGDHPIFKESLLKYIKPLIIKGVPSVVNDLKNFYRQHPKKAVVLGELL